jgi:hypothetical protein
MEGDASDHSCDYKMRGGTTHSLELEGVTCQPEIVVETRDTYVLEERATGRTTN